MALNDPLGNVLSHINNCDKIGKPEIVVKPASKLIISVLNLMKENGYLGSFEVIKDGRSNLIKINLLGNINKCGVIKPRFAFKTEDLNKFEKRFLPARDFGFIIVSTSKGLMTHNDARKNKFGGRLIAYVY
ncbi:MAG: 30S ribosomal protein S8 [Nanoarchaeota archaeon]